METFCFVASEANEVGTGLWSCFVMLVLAIAADELVLKQRHSINPCAGLGVSGECRTPVMLRL